MPSAPSLMVSSWHNGKLHLKKHVSLLFVHYKELDILPYFPIPEDILIRNIHSYIKLTKKIKVLKENYCWIKFLSKVSGDLVLCSNFLTIVSSDLTWLTFTSVMSNIADIINTNKPASTGALTFSPHHIYINLSNSRKLTDNEIDFSN